jgi:replicative DNA helicase
MIDAERAVLGACLLDPQAYWRIADVVTAEDFTPGEGRNLFAAVVALIRDGSASDAVTVGELHPDLGNLALTVANSDGWRTGNVRAYAEIIAARSMTRRVKAAGQRIAQVSDADAYGEAQRILAACAPRNTSAMRPIWEFMRESVQAMQVRANAGGELTGLATSIAGLDALTSGWQRTDLIILAARPSVGKTAMAGQVAVHAATAGHPVLFFSMEMSGVQLSDRVQSHLAHVDSMGMRDPVRLDDADWTRLFGVVGAIESMPLLIDDSSSLTVEAICARARQANAAQRLGLIVIDYLTQMMPPKAQSTNDAWQIVTRQLKALAKDLAVPIILLSQLNRQGEHRPTLSALRDSGAIEQDADLVVFLHRPNASRPAHIELILAKQRNGPTGSVWLDADMAHMRFTESEDGEPVDTHPSRQRGFGRRPADGWQGYQ